MSDKQLNQYACTRCRRLKKKCSKEFPKCANCLKQNEACEYVERKNKRRHPALTGSGTVKASAAQARQRKVSRSDLSATPGSSSSSETSSPHQVLRPLVASAYQPWIAPLNGQGVVQSSVQLPLSGNALPPLQFYLGAAPASSSVGPSTPTTPGATSVLPPMQFYLGATAPTTTSTPTSATSATSGTTLPPLLRPVQSTSDASKVPVSIYSLQQQQSAVRGNPQVNKLFVPQLPPIVAPNTSTVHRTSSITGSVDSTTFSGLPNNSSVASSVSSSTLASVTQSTAGTSSTPPISIKLEGGRQGIAGFPFGEEDKPSLFYTAIVRAFFTEDQTGSPVGSPAIGSVFPQLIVPAALDAYFAHTHQEYPFLVEQEIRSRANSLDFQTTLATTATAEVFLVLAVGCYVLESTGAAPKNKRYPEYFFARARSVVCCDGMMLTGIETLHLLILLCIYFTYGADRNRCWMALGALKQLALALHLKSAEEKGSGSSVLRSRLLLSISSVERAVTSCFPMEADMSAPKDGTTDGTTESTTLASTGSSLSPEGGIVGVPNPAGPLNLEYQQLLMLLCKPSGMMPQPSSENLEVLAKCAMQGLSFIYTLYTSTWFRNSWNVFYRFLSVNRTLLYCLSHESIDMNQVKSNLPHIREMLEYFARTWPYASQLAEVVSKIDASLGDVQKLKQLSIEFQKVLCDNDVDLWPADVRPLIEA